MTWRDRKLKMDLYISLSIVHQLMMDRINVATEDLVTCFGREKQAAILEITEALTSQEMPPSTMNVLYDVLQNIEGLERKVMALEAELKRTQKDNTPVKWPCPGDYLNSEFKETTNYLLDWLYLCNFCVYFILLCN